MLLLPVSCWTLAFFPLHKTNIRILEFPPPAYCGFGGAYHVSNIEIMPRQDTLDFFSEFLLYIQGPGKPVSISSIAAFTGQEGT